MSRGQIPPHSIEAEEALIGAALLRQQVVGQLAGTLDPSDFYKPFHQRVWEIMLTLHAKGAPIDQVTVGESLDDAQRRDLLACLVGTPSVSAASRYAETIIETSRRRRLMFHYSQLADECYERSADEVLAMDDPKADRLIAARGDDVEGLMSLAEFVAKARERADRGEWLIPHILRELHRLIIVAGEGVGKGTLMRYLGLMAACGRDPWDDQKLIVPRRVLYIDAENPESTILHQIDLAYPGMDIIGESDGRYHIWSREGGMNLRDRRTQAQIENVLQKTRPEIVFAGPLYKMFQRSASEDMEQATIELLCVLDDFRTRYNFALVMEHHAPKGNGGYRDMNPFGSSALMRWPDFGITLEPIGNPLPHELAMALEVGRFRRDREPVDWPPELRRGYPGQRAAWNARFTYGRNRQGFADGVS